MQRQTSIQRINPFSVSPDPTALYFTPALEAATFRVRYTIDNRQGFAAILGDVGLGKSSLVRYLHSSYDASEHTTSILLPSGRFKSEFTFLQSLSQAVGLPMKRSAASQQRLVESWLGEQYMTGRNVVLFIDEAQKLSDSLLELTRDFLNFETDQSKLIQIVLAGQLELRDRLLDPRLKALYSRLIGPCLLTALGPDEIPKMVDFRCKLYKVENQFTPASLTQVYVLTGGVPRAALRLCAFAQEWARLLGSEKIEPIHVDSAWKDLQIAVESENGEEGA